MKSNLDRYKADLKRLLELGDMMELDLMLRIFGERKEGDLDAAIKEVTDGKRENFDKEYQHWYTEARATIECILPGRLGEFDDLYRGDGRRKSVNVETYNIQDWLLSRRSDRSSNSHINDLEVICAKFQTQLEILRSSNARFESSLFDIQQLLQADLFDSELASARELLKTGFLRAAGAIAAVVLERHLSRVCANHDLTTRKRNPSISTWNDLLKERDLVDLPTSRFVQRLGDLRNLCDHDKNREPTKEDVDELITGAEKVVKTLF